MDERSRRFVHQGILGVSLDDPMEQDVLVDFFVNTLLPLKVTTNKIAELIVKELEKQLLIGGSESFQQFGVEWRPKDLGS